MNNLKDKKGIIKEIESNNKKVKEVKLKSEMYNHDNELLNRREEDNNDAMMWGFVIGFALFFVLLIMIICFTF